MREEKRKRLRCFKRGVSINSIIELMLISVGVLEF